MAIQVRGCFGGFLSENPNCKLADAAFRALHFVARDNHTDLRPTLSNSSIKTSKKPKLWQIDLFLSRSFSAIPNWQRAFHVFGSKGTVPAQIQKGPYWHSSYLSQPPRPAVVYFFQAGAPFSIENAKFWLFLHKFTHFLVPLLQAWIVWVWGMPNCILTQCLSRLWTR